MVKLELVIRGKVQDDISFQDWSTAAHDYLVAAFKDLTKPSAHALWKLQEG